MPRPVTITIDLRVTPARVWEALTDPAQIRQYLFGTEAVCDWRVGSPLRFRGAWEGKTYEDKGTILESAPGKRLSYSYWSSMGGLPDTPDHYRTVTFDIVAHGETTRLALTQGTITTDTDETMAHTASNWTMVLDGLKKIIEG